MPQQGKVSVPTAARIAGTPLPFPSPSPAALKQYISPAAEEEKADSAVAAHGEADQPSAEAQEGDGDAAELHIYNL